MCHGIRCPDNVAEITPYTICISLINYVFQRVLKIPNILSEEISKYDINLAILENSQANFSLVRDTGKLELDYVGTSFSLFRKDQANFPALGTLLAYPACWNNDLAKALEIEQARAISLLPAESHMLPFIRYMVDYNDTEDKNSLLKILEDVPRASDALLRFAGHQAIIQSQNSSAYKIFLGINEKAFGDYLGGALAAARMGEWKTAEEMLDMGTRVSWSEKTFEISILYGLLTQIRQHSELGLFDEAYVNRLAEKIGIDGASSSVRSPEAQEFCPDI